MPSTGTPTAASARCASRAVAPGGEHVVAHDRGDWIARAGERPQRDGAGGHRAGEVALPVRGVQPGLVGDGRPSGAAGGSCGRRSRWRRRMPAACRVTRSIGSWPRAVTTAARDGTGTRRVRPPGVDEVAGRDREHLAERPHEGERPALLVRQHHRPQQVRVVATDHGGRQPRRAGVRAGPDGPVGQQPSAVRAEQPTGPPAVHAGGAGDQVQPGVQHPSSVLSRTGRGRAVRPRPVESAGSAGVRRRAEAGDRARRDPVALRVEPDHPCRRRPRGRAAGWSRASPPPTSRGRARGRPAPGRGRRVSRQGTRTRPATRPASGPARRGRWASARRGPRSGRGRRAARRSGARGSAGSGRRRRCAAGRPTSAGRPRWSPRPPPAACRHG